MTSRRSGHFVQIFRRIAPVNDWHAKPTSPRDHRHHPNYTRVEGRPIAITVTGYPSYAPDGWFYVSRELSRKDAVRFAKAYRRAGFPSRVLFCGNDGKSRITDEFKPNRRRH